MNKNYSLYLLHAKIDAMSKFLNLDKIIEGEKNSHAQIRSYYRINHWAFRFFHSQDGFMHFRVSTKASSPTRMSITSPTSFPATSSWATLTTIPQMPTLAPSTTGY